MKRQPVCVYNSGGNATLRCQAKGCYVHDYQPNPHKSMCTGDDSPLALSEASQLPPSSFPTDTEGRLKSPFWHVDPGH